MNTSRKTKPKFALGLIVITRSALDVLHSQDVLAGLARHVVGDWGELDSHDWQENQFAVETGNLRILSAYETRDGIRFWVITEADRSATTVLLPEDY